MTYKVYILHSISLGKFYFSHTGDGINERLRRHLSDPKGFTGTAKDWEVVYTEDFDAKSKALRREMTIKGWKSKRMISQLIEKHSSASSEHPDL